MNICWQDQGANTSTTSVKLKLVLFGDKDLDGSLLLLRGFPNSTVSQGAGSAKRPHRGSSSTSQPLLTTRCFSRRLQFLSKREKLKQMFCVQICATQIAKLKLLSPGCGSEGISNCRGMEKFSNRRRSVLVGGVTSFGSQKPNWCSVGIYRGQALCQHCLSAIHSSFRILKEQTSQPCSLIPVQIRDSRLLRTVQVFWGLSSHIYH